MSTEKELLAKKELLALKQDKLTPGAGIIIDKNNVISATGGGGGSTVSVLPLVTTGTKIATIIVDAIERDLYAPGADVQVSPSLATGVQIATITVNGVDYYLYAPQGGSGGGNQVYFGTTDPSDAIGNDKDFYYKLTNLRNTYPVYSHLKLVVNANRNNDNYTQLSEVNILDTSDNTFNWSGTTVVCNAVTSAGDGPENLIDGLTTTKACAEATPDPATPIEFTFTLGIPIDTETYQSWCWYTADDESGRDPVSFDFYGSTDGELWELLTSATAQEITTTREALAYTSDFTLSVGDIAILNKYIKIDDTWIEEAGGSGNVADVYVNGTSVLDENDIAQVFSHKEVTEQEYEALPTTKESDNIMYCIKGSRPSTNGNYFTPIIYSTEEREVGVWADGKPLYQKTILAQTSTTSNSIEALHNISNLGEVVHYETNFRFKTNDYDQRRFIPQFYSDMSSTYSATLYYIDSTKVYLYYGDWLKSMTSGEQTLKITLWYTKDSDTAGSGQYTTLGIPAHHYDGNEKVVGTYFGETLYEKTIHITEASEVETNQYTTEIQSLNADKVFLVNGRVKLGSIANGAWINSPYFNSVNYNTSMGVTNTEITVVATGWKYTEVELTIQYTKSAD